MENTMTVNKVKLTLLTSALILITLVNACTGWEQLTNREVDDREMVQDNDYSAQIISLPDPVLQGSMTLEETLVNRRSVRQFKDTLLSEVQIGQLLWAAQGITYPTGLRTAPSAGALYPLEIYAATPEGLFHYKPQTHSMERLLDQDPRPDLYQAALRQNSVLEAPLVIVINAVFERTAQRYGEARTPQYVYLEAGHTAQNIHLQAVALELGSVPIGAFHEDQIVEALSLPSDEVPLYLIPIGYPQQ